MKLKMAIPMLAAILAVPLAALAAEPAALTKPTPSQAEWQDDEVSMFFHIDMPIYTSGGHGNGVNWKSCGHLNPDLFNPVKLDTDQWMQAAEAIGAKHTVFVAKHCSGFIMWQSDAYPYGLKQTKWRGGKGDILRDYVASCRKAGIKPGIYVSWPANGYFGVDRGKVNLGRGGDPARQAAYVKAYEKLIAEAYGNYGPLFEIWFDGGIQPVEQGGPDAASILAKLQPQAVVFQGPSVNSIRWVGNERGIAPDPCWSTVKRRGDTGRGNPDGTVWSPAECDVPIRNHDWFWQPGGSRKLYSLKQLMDIYYHSVGRNCNLILNANINRDGLVPEADMQRYREFGAEVRRRFGHSVAETSGQGDLLTLTLPHATPINHVMLMEDIRQGQRIRKFVVEGLCDGQWKTLCEAQSVGHKRIDQFPSITVSAVRLRVTASIAPPIIRRMAVFNVTDLN